MKARFYTKIFICFISIIFQSCGCLFLSVIPHRPSLNKGQPQQELSEQVFLITFTAFTNSSMFTIFCYSPFVFYIYVTFGMKSTIHRFIKTVYAILIVVGCEPAPSIPFAKAFGTTFFNI